MLASTVAAAAEYIGMQTVLNRRPTIPRNAHKVFQTQYADIFRAHRVIVGCRGGDREMVVVDATSDIPSRSRQVTLIGQI